MAKATYNLGTINIYLQSVPLQRASFGNVLLLVDEADGNDLDGDRFVTYTNYPAAEDDFDAGFISADTLAKLQAAFSQTVKPKKILVGRVDTGAGTPETYQAALGLCEDAGADYFGLCIDSRTDTVIAAVAGAIETRKKMFWFQGNDSSWLNSGVPSGFSSIVSYNNTFGVYHNDNDQPSDIAALSNQLAYNADNQSTQWNIYTIGVEPYASLTQTQADAAIANNINLGYEHGTCDFYIPNAKALNGRNAYEILTKHWLDIRLNEDLIQFELDKALAGEKIEITDDGARQIQCILDGRVLKGIQAGHFVGMTQYISSYTLDTDTKTITFEVSLQSTTGAESIVFNINVSRSAVVEE